jgi:DNA-binding winged helix-turn-helix (wHTH) protein
MTIYKFRNCLLNTFERRLIRDGKPLELTPRTFDVLQLLTEKSGEIVSKDEMLGKIWKGTLVEESNLPVHISKLRRLLRTTEAERFIQTVYGIGYRFISHVIPVSENAWLEHLYGDGDLSESIKRDLALDSTDHQPKFLTFLTGRIRVRDQFLVVKIEVLNEKDIACLAIAD